jgi:hypothetical protein
LLFFLATGSQKFDDGRRSIITASCALPGSVYRHLVSKISARRPPELLFSKFAIQECLKVLLEGFA